MAVSVGGGDAVDGDADTDDVACDDYDDDDGGGGGGGVADDDDDDAEAVPGSCGSSCRPPSSREHTGPRNRVSPVPRATPGTRLHVDETTTPIDRYPRWIRAPGGESLHGGRCSRDSQGHGVTCHEDIPMGHELPPPASFRHPRFRDHRRSKVKVKKKRKLYTFFSLLEPLSLLSLAIPNFSNSQ